MSEQITNKSLEAMRESLMQRAADLISNVMTGKLAIGPVETIEEIDRIISKALDAPVRNCNIGTSDEQAERFHGFCQSHTSSIGGMCDSGCPCIGSPDLCHCLTKWMSLPYEEAKGNN